MPGPKTLFTKRTTPFELLAHHSLSLPSSPPSSPLSFLSDVQTRIFSFTHKPAHSTHAFSCPLHNADWVPAEGFAGARPNHNFNQITHRRHTRQSAGAVNGPRRKDELDVAVGAPHKLVLGSLARALDQHRLHRPHALAVGFGGAAGEDFNDLLEPGLFHIGGNVVFEAVVRACLLTHRVREEETCIKPHPLQEVDRVAVVGIGLAAKSGDEVGAQGDIGDKVSNAIHQSKVGLSSVPSAHSIEHRIRSRLGRQMDRIANIRVVSNHFEDLVCKVLRMG
mmetsp:Transcript_16967/g.44180  ORF Transcript_16967/g.44180 Transcript_16967/m.44180 type:complete len:279 (+) Transcript_16967:1311-2147(+)